MQDSENERMHESAAEEMPVKANDLANALEETVKQEIGRLLGETEWREITDSLSPDTVQDVMDEVGKQLRDDPNFQQASERLQQNVAQAAIVGGMELGEFLNEGQDILGDFFSAFFRDNQEVIWNLAVTAAGKILTSEQAMQLIQGKAMDLVTQLIADFFEGKEPKTMKALSLLGSIVTLAVGEEVWRNWVDAIATGYGAIAPLLESGFNLYSAVAYLANLVPFGGSVKDLGTLISMMADPESKREMMSRLNASRTPFVVKNAYFVYANNSTYMGVTGNGVTMLFDMHPSLFRNPVIITSSARMVSSAAESLVAKGASTVAGASIVGGIVRSVIRAIDNEKSKEVAIAELTEEYGLSRIPENTLQRTISSFLDQAWDYVKVLRSKIILPDTDLPTQGSSASAGEQKPTDSMPMETADESMPYIDDVLVPTADQRGFRPGGRYAYRIGSSAEKS